MSWEARAQRARERAVRDLIVVPFGNLAVSPQNVYLAAGERVVWTNHSDYFAQVVFPVGVAESLECDVLGSEWQRTDEHLASLPIEGGRLDLVLPCALAPGSYPYQIYLLRGRGEKAGVSDPELRLTARLIVR